MVAPAALHLYYQSYRRCGSLHGADVRYVVGDTTNSSCPAFRRASTSLFRREKAWVGGASPAMTKWNPGDRATRDCSTIPRTAYGLPRAEIDLLDLRILCERGGG